MPAVCQFHAENNDMNIYKDMNNKLFFYSLDSFNNEHSPSRVVSVSLLDCPSSFARIWSHKVVQTKQTPARS